MALEEDLYQKVFCGVWCFQLCVGLFGLNEIKGSLRIMRNRHVTYVKKQKTIFFSWAVKFKELGDHSFVEIRRGWENIFRGSSFCSP